jgi:hypothetical protein
MRLGCRSRFPLWVMLSITLGIACLLALPARAVSDSVATIPKSVPVRPSSSHYIKKPPVPDLDPKPSLQETIGWLYEKLNTATYRPMLYSDPKTVLYPRVRHDHGLSYMLRSYTVLPTQDLCHLNFTPKIEASTRYSGSRVNFQSVTRSFGVIPLDLAHVSAHLSNGDLVLNLPSKSTFNTQVYATSCQGDCHYWKNLEDRVFTHAISQIRLGTRLDNPNQFLNTLDHAKSLCKPKAKPHQRLTQ